MYESHVHIYAMKVISFNVVSVRTRRIKEVTTITMI